MYILRRKRTMDNAVDMLTIVAVILFMIVVVLVMVYWYMKRKENSPEKQENNNSNNIENPKLKTKETAKQTSQYTKLSVFDFMEFDKIEDNMIVQNGGKRYLMVISCEGINYDLMSEVEKTSVEAGFVQFLNTLRHPIQLYTQTRTINISSSIENYTKKIEEVKQQLDKKQMEYNKMLQSGSYSTTITRELRTEIARLQNLYDYGKDITQNIEKMSLNKNVLKKHYYIVIPYNTSDLGNDMLSDEEKKQMVFSELYTRSQALIRTLFACSMKCKVMDSYELAELLYVAYNRDESEVYGIEKALKAGYTELYSTAPDVLDKKMEALNKEIEAKALEMAKEYVDEIRSEKEKAVEKKEKTFDELVKDMTKIVLKENEQYIGKEVTKEAIERVDGKAKNTKEGGKANDKEEKKRTRRTTKTNADA
jgi:preprotein translocase subunit SecG